MERNQTIKISYVIVVTYPAALLTFFCKCPLSRFMKFTHSHVGQPPMPFIKNLTDFNC